MQPRGSRRAALAQAFDRIGLTGAALRLRRLPSRWRTGHHGRLPILTYHRIGKPGRGQIDPRTIDATPEQFEAQVAWLARHHQFVDSRDLDAALYGGRALPDHPVMLTFDDGYRECLDNALPILRRHGAKAVFFVATDFVEHRRLMWWDRIALVGRRSARDTVELEYPVTLTLDRRSLPTTAVGIVKTHYGLDLERFLAEIERAAGVTISPDEERALVDAHLLKWGELRQLLDAGMDLQSHTAAHRVVQTMPPAHLRRDLRRAADTFAARLGFRPHAVAYPVGYPLPPRAIARSILAETGHRIGFSNATGINDLDGVDRWDVRRIATATETSLAELRATFAVPWFYARRSHAPAVGQ